MPPRLLFLPDTWMAPRACELIPAVAGMLGALRQRFDVEVFAWPWARGSRNRDPELNAMIQSLRDHEPEGQHVLALSSAAWLPVMAFLEGVRARSFTSQGFFVPPATLQALGLPSAMSEAALLLFSGATGTSQFLRQSMANVPVEEVTRLSHALDAELEFTVDSDKAVAFFRHLDLSERDAVTDIPVLYLKSPEDPATLAVDNFAIFQRLFPDAELEEVSGWPAGLERRENGLEVARRVVAFSERVEAGRSGEENG